MGKFYDLELAETLVLKCERENVLRWIRHYADTPPETKKWLADNYDMYMPDSLRREIRAKIMEKLDGEIAGGLFRENEYRPIKINPPELSGVVHDYFKTERKRNHGKTV